MENILHTDWSELENFTKNSEKNGLMDGKMGSAFFFLVLSEHWKGDGPVNLALEILHNAFTAFFKADSLLNMSLGYGISGLAYVIDKFKSHSVVMDSIDSGFMSEIDSLILNVIPLQIDSQNLGFMNGAAGNLYYLINRSDEITNHQEKIQDIVKKLYLNAIKDADGIRFENGSLHSNLKMVGFEEHHNLSLSDGMTGILIVLLHAYAKYPNTQHLKELIKEGIKFILGLEREVSVEEKRICYYPTIVSREKKKRDEKIEFYNSRLGWCIGDLTVSLLLCKAGRLLEKSEWTRQGIRIAEFTLQRKSTDFTKIENAALCHGACGVAAIYKTLSELTGRERLLKEGYEFWMKKASSEALEDKEENWDLLNGKTGIALAKLEWSGQISFYSWKDLFLL